MQLYRLWSSGLLHIAVLWIDTNFKEEYARSWKGQYSCSPFLLAQAGASLLSLPRIWVNAFPENYLHSTTQLIPQNLAMNPKRGLDAKEHWLTDCQWLGFDLTYFDSEDGGSMILWNVGIPLQHYTMPKPKIRENYRGSISLYIDFEDWSILNITLLITNRNGMYMVSLDVTHKIPILHDPVHIPARSKKFMTRLCLFSEPSLDVDRQWYHSFSLQFIFISKWIPISRGYVFPVLNLVPRHEDVWGM